MRGAHLDSRTVRIELEIHGDILKFSDYNEIVQYVNSGNMSGLVRNKIGQNEVDYLDIMARNAFLQHPNKTYSGDATSRNTLEAADLFDPDMCETIRVHLEENDIPGVSTVDDGGGAAILCTTTPRVIKDIRTGDDSKWLEVQEYAGSVRKFTNEVGSWAGMRFAKSNRLKLWNHGNPTAATTLTADTNPGEGAKATVDVVYSVGQSGAKQYVEVTDDAVFSIGETVTIHSQSALGDDDEPLESDGTQETRRIVDIDADNDRLYFNKPLLKPHTSGDQVTNGVDVHTAIFHGGPGVVYGVGERPHVILPPKYDDLMMVNRYGWRGFLKFQMFRPEFFEVVESAGSTD